ncbi:MAG: hypothetical protein KKB38_20145, partial [Gammaproteobacteria bacterium]|nr:hypothetical protein [Gammaproteobacteria bacterium]
TAAVTGIKSWTVDYVFDALEGTGFDSSGHRVYTPGLDGWSGSFEGYKDGTPLTIGTEVALILKESATATQKWYGQAIITGAHPAGAVDGLIAISYDFQGTGALTIPTA